MSPASFFSMLACPQCTYDNVMPTWYWFAGIRLSIVLLISIGRLDIVRTLGLFAIYEAAYFSAWRFLIALTYQSGGEEIIGLIGLLIVGGGVPAVATLWSAAQIPYFRRSVEMPLTLKRSMVLIPIFLLVNFLQTSMR